MALAITRTSIDLGIVTTNGEAVAACAAAGAKVVMKEREIRPGVKIAIVADPDGNWVEFLTLG